MTNENEIPYGEYAKQNKPIEVKWLDAYEAGGEWFDSDYRAERRTMITYGYALSVNAEYLSVGSTWDTDLDQFACVINIPLGMILNISPITMFVPPNMRDIKKKAV